jgi:predicted RecB family nuclease
VVARVPPAKFQDAGSLEQAAAFIPATHRLWPMSGRDPQADQRLQITDEVLFQFHRCQRRAYLEYYGDASLQTDPSDYLLKIRQDSLSHRRQSLQRYVPYHRPAYPAGDWQAGGQATLQLMEQGVAYIYQAVLTARGGDGVWYISYPDVLVRQDVSSWLGAWSYLPMDIRLGKKPKQEYQLVATFHAYLLSALQGFCPRSSRLILREKQYEVDVARQLPQLLEMLTTCVETLTATTSPEVFISRSRCDMCVWLPHCYQVAQAQQHLSLLPGVTLNRYRHLTSLGLTTVEALAQISPMALSLASGFEAAVAERLVHQAQSTLQGVAIARRKPSLTGQFPLKPQDLPSAEVELYFDIEASPDRDLVYLHGVLVVDTRQQQEMFIPLIAEQPVDEASAWLHFQHVVAQYPEAPIYHFCPYEAQRSR